MSKRTFEPRWTDYFEVLNANELKAFKLYHGAKPLSYSEVAELMRDPAVNTLQAQVLVSSAISKLRAAY
jgi:hypothetical protein